MHKYIITSSRLTGERLATWKRVKKQDICLCIIFIIVTIINPFDKMWALVSLPAIVLVVLYRLVKKETTWQLVRMERETGKKQSKKILREMMQIKGSR